MDHILAVYALGGSPEAIEETYLSHDYNDAVHPSPNRITDANFFEHLGDPECVIFLVARASFANTFSVTATSMPTPSTSAKLSRALRPRMLSTNMSSHPPTTLTPI